MMNETTQTIVTVIIPSRNRPQLVSRSVKSALAQTVELIEVIVVVDGPDEFTVKELKQIEDPRLIVIELPSNKGASGARNEGVKVARGTWIAFLDDDDEWLPEKIERQLEIANQSSYAYPIVCCRFFAITGSGKLIWPKRLPLPSEHISEYLYVRQSLVRGETCIYTSTILTKKQLLEKTPFNENLPVHEDWEWLLKVCQDGSAGVEFLPEPMAVLNVTLTTNRESLSNRNNWQYSLDWIRSVSHLVTPRAYSSFITTIVSSQAALQGNWQSFFPLLGEVVTVGNPRPLDICSYLLMWLVPQTLRQRLRLLFINRSSNLEDTN